MKKGDKVYYARIIPNISYDVYELKVRMVEDTWFSATEKINKTAFLFNYDAIGKIIFEDRNIALKVVKEAEKNRKVISSEKYYEEY